MNRFLILLLVVMASCGQKKMVDQYKSQDQNYLSVDSNNLTPAHNVEILTPLIAQDTSLYHVYDGVRLEKTDEGLYRARDIAGYDYAEGFPGIVAKITSQGSKIVETKIFETTNGELINSITTKSLNPYLNKEYKNLLEAYPSFEYYEGPAENEKHLYEGVEPDGYLTFSNGMGTCLNGYTYIRYCLVPLKGNVILSWETSTFILKQDGSILSIWVDGNYSTPVKVSRDGRLFGYMYGGNTDNPYNKHPNGEFRIVDLHSGEIVYRIDGRIGNTGSEYDYLVQTKGDLKESPFKMEIKLIDLNQRKVYIKEFSKEEFLKAIEGRKSYRSMLMNYRFTPKSF